MLAIAVGDDGQPGRWSPLHWPTAEAQLADHHPSQKSTTIQIVAIVDAQDSTPGIGQMTSFQSEGHTMRDASKETEQFALVTQSKTTESVIPVTRLADH